MKSNSILRKCHVCGHLNESHSDVDRCENCSKPLAPFFYFDFKQTIPWSDYQLRPKSIPGEYLPIRGLTVYWESD